MSRNRDKQTILNTLATVGVWNGTIIYPAAPIPISPKISHSPLHVCQRFGPFVMIG